MALVRPVKRRVSLFGFLLFLPDGGLVDGFGGRASIGSLSLPLSAWIFMPAVEGMMAKLEVRPDSLPIRLWVASMPRTEGILRIASVRDLTMNRPATLGILTRRRMVVLLSMRPATGFLRNLKISQIVKYKNWEVDNLECEGLMVVVPRNGSGKPEVG